MFKHLVIIAIFSLWAGCAIKTDPAAPQSLMAESPTPDPAKESAEAEESAGPSEASKAAADEAAQEPEAKADSEALRLDDSVADEEPKSDPSPVPGRSGKAEEKAISCPAGLCKENCGNAGDAMAKCVAAFDAGCFGDTPPSKSKYDCDWRKSTKESPKKTSRATRSPANAQPAAEEKDPGNPVDLIVHGE